MMDNGQEIWTVAAFECVVLLSSGTLSFYNFVSFAIIVVHIENSWKLHYWHHVFIFVLFHLIWLGATLFDFVGQHTSRDARKDFHIFLKKRVGHLFSSVICFYAFHLLVQCVNLAENQWIGQQFIWSLLWFSSKAFCWWGKWKIIKRPSIR